MKILKPNWIFGHKCMLKYVWITFSEKILQCKTFAIMLIVPITKTTHSLTLVKGQQKIQRRNFLYDVQLIFCSNAFT